MAGSVTGIRAGKAFILIEAVDATGKVLNSVRARLGKFGTEMSNIGRRMAMRAIAALTPVAFAVKSGTAYDDIMRKVEARSEGTAMEMMNLRKQTLELGRTFGILPSKMGAIQNIFAQAGFNRKEIADVAPAVAALARAGSDATGSFDDTVLAADAVRAVLRSFHMEADQAANVADKLSVALRISNFSLEDINTSLQYGAPAAHFYKVSLDDMLSIMGAMRDLGIDASIAGTAFRNMNAYMSQGKERDKFNQQLQALTGNTISFTDALGNLRSPAEILPAIIKATQGLGTAERSDLISQLLEMRATIPSVAVGESLDRMATMRTALQNFKGDAKRVQQLMDSGLGGAFRRFAATLEEVAIKFQSALAPSLETATSSFDQLLKFVADWIIQNPGLVGGVAAFVMGMAALGTALVVAGQGVIALSALFGLGAILASITAYLLAFVAPWAALVIGVRMANKAIDDFTGSADTTAMFDKVFSDAIAHICKGIGDMVKDFINAGKTIYDEWSTTIQSVAASIAGGDIAGAITTLAAQIKVTWVGLTNSMADIWDDLQDYLAAASAGAAAAAFARQANAFDDWVIENFGDFGGLLSHGHTFSDEYIQHLEDTVANKLEEVQNTPAGKARQDSRRWRADELNRARGDASLAQAEAEAELALRQSQAARERRKREREAAPVNPAAERAKMEAAAAALIGPAAVNVTPAKKAVEGLDYRSVDAMKAFIENKYNQTTEKILSDIKGEVAGLRADIKAKDGVGVL